MGLHLVEPGFRTRLWVEIEEYPRRTIIAAQEAGYFAPADIWDDVTTFDARPFRGAFDTILAGYPCQPFSHAGQRKGADDERHLWPDVARIVGEVEPEWVFLENVAGHVSLGAETVLRELRDMGYTPAAGLFSAAETGAPHERLRWFCVAHRDTDADAGRLDGGRVIRSAPEGQEQGEERQRLRLGAGSGGDELGHATRPRRESERTGAGSKHEGGEPLPWARSGTTANAERNAGYQGGCGRGRDKSAQGTWEADCAGAQRPFLHPPGPADMGRWAGVLADAPHLAPAVSLGDVKRAANQVAAMAQAGLVAEAEIEPALRRMADALSRRPQSLRLLGNAVVPIQAAYAWRTLSAAHGLPTANIGDS